MVEKIEEIGSKTQLEFLTERGIRAVRNVNSGGALRR
jgi:hypothetical protein